MKRTIASLLLLFIPLAACMATEGSEVLEAGEIGEVNAPLLTETYPPPPCIPTEEVCDEVDNNCDGDIDECGCPPPCIPTEEVCDEADNDCDGVIDECGCPPACIPTEEVCDGADNNCDGDIDECGCPPPCIPTEEVCDEADNDCDGDIDECGCPPPPPPCSDNDDDGVCAEDDLCPGTEVGETKVPSIALGVNRFALVDEDFQFDTMLPYGQGPQKSYTTTDTGGCSCEQIIKKQSLGQGHTKFGCSISAMDDWVAIVNAN